MALFQVLSKSRSKMAFFSTIPREGQVDVSISANGLAIMTLNRPNVLNSLSLEMVQQINAHLLKWKEDKSVKAVLFKGAGVKSFCAGGDVVKLATDKDAARKFFRNEYFMNYLISSYFKTTKIPIISLIHGIVMGGGVGISLHGNYRLASETTTFAMPETQIGFFPDVGASFLLPRLKSSSLGMYCGLTGKRVKGLDLLVSGVATHYIPSSLHNDLVEKLSSINLGIPDIESTLNHFHNPTDTVTLFTMENMKSIESAFHKKVGSVENVLSELERLEKDGSEFAAASRKEILSKSPLALKVTFRALNENSNRTLPDALKTEFRLGLRVTASHDFKEGVRALLVEKDNKPNWVPSKLEDVTKEMVDDCFSPLGKNEPREFSVLELPVDDKHMSPL